MLHPKARGKVTWIAPAGEYTLNVRLCMSVCRY
jgi:vacuolar-type H+-ATPase catalytic subunit A/Vma1